MSRTRSTVLEAPASQSGGTIWIDTRYPYGDGPWRYAGSYTSTAGAGKYSSRRWTVDETHPGPPYRTGGPFQLISFWTNQYEQRGAGVHFAGPYKVEGEGFLPNPYPSSYHSWASPEYMATQSKTDAEAMGATGWNRFRPTNSGADLGQFLGEFKDVPRMLRSTADAFRTSWKAMGGSGSGFGPKSVADQWLNTQFGWLPFISDLRKFYKTTKNLDRRLKQLRRDNGQWVKRGGSLGSSSEQEVVIDKPTSIGLWPAYNSYFLSSAPYGSQYLTRTTSVDTWFEGRFRYWIPGKPDTWQWNARAYAQIYGAQPSPSLVWELTPWSWLVDWCSNVGDVIANISSIGLDNLAAKYAYVMRHVMQKCDMTGSLNLKSGRITHTWSSIMETKTRVAASPFGFGLSSGDFSARQWSILSALGLSRLS